MPSRSLLVAIILLIQLITVIAALIICIDLIEMFKYDKTGFREIIGEYDNIKIHPYDHCYHSNLKKNGCFTKHPYINCDNVKNNTQCCKNTCPENNSLCGKLYIYKCTIRYSMQFNFTFTDNKIKYHVPIKKECYSSACEPIHGRIPLMIKTIPTNETEMFQEYPLNDKIYSLWAIPFGLAVIFIVVDYNKFKVNEIQPEHHDVFVARSGMFL